MYFGIADQFADGLLTGLSVISTDHAMLISTDYVMLNLGELRRSFKHPGNPLRSPIDFPLFMGVVCDGWDHSMNAALTTGRFDS